MHTNKKWLVLSRNNIGNFIYKFSLFDGNRIEVSKYLEEMKREDIINSKQEIEYDEPNIFFSTSDINDKTLCTFVEFSDSYIDYYAIPITSEFNWIIAEYIGGINEYNFYFISTDNKEIIINKVKEIWSNEYRKHEGEDVPNPTIRQNENNISIEMFLSDIGSIDIIAFSSKLLENKQTFVFGNN